MRPWSSPVVSRRLAIAVATGVVWGGVATMVHLAMFRGYMPGPADSAFPIAVLLYVVRAPFIAAIYLSTFLLGRSSPTLVELVIESLMFGAIAGLGAAALLLRVRRPSA